LAEIWVDAYLYAIRCRNRPIPPYTRLRKHCTNFYVLETETMGFKRHDGTDKPVQIVVIFYEDGRESKMRCYERYFLT